MRSVSWYLPSLTRTAVANQLLEGIQAWMAQLDIPLARLRLDGDRVDNGTWAHLTLTEAEYLLFVIQWGDSEFAYMDSHRWSGDLPK